MLSVTAPNDAGDDWEFKSVSRWAVVLLGSCRVLPFIFLAGFFFFLAPGRPAALDSHPPSSHLSVWHFCWTRSIGWRATLPWQHDTVSVRQNQSQAGIWKRPPPLLFPHHPLMFAAPGELSASLCPFSLSACLISSPLTEPVHREEPFGLLLSHNYACIQQPVMVETLWSQIFQRPAQDGQRDRGRKGMRDREK